jgi:hypothetical protein
LFEASFSPLSSSGKREFLDGFQCVVLTFLPGGRRHAERKKRVRPTGCDFFCNLTPNYAE